MTERNAINFEKTYANRYVSEMQKNQNLKLEILPNNDTQVVHLIGRSGLHTFPSDPEVGTASPCAALQTTSPQKLF